MKRKYVIALVFAALGGSALHFLYDIIPNPLTALISPINESVWEHLKLLFWPTVVAALILSKKCKLGSNGYWGGFFIGILLMPILLLGLYYALKAGFGVEGLVLDLFLYFLTMAVGFWAACHTAQSRWVSKAAPYLLLPVILYGAALILFTFAAPNLPVFQPPM